MPGLGELVAVVVACHYAGMPAGASRVLMTVSVSGVVTAAVGAVSVLVVPTLSFSLLGSCLVLEHVSCEFTYSRLRVSCGSGAMSSVVLGAGASSVG